MTYDQFEEKYTLVKNHFVGDAPNDGTMFETFGAELDFVSKQPEKNIWTLTDSGEQLLIVAGWHFVDRLGYFLTEQEFTEEYETYDYV